MTNHIFDPQDCKTINGIVREGGSGLYPSSHALKRAIDSFVADDYSDVERCSVSVGADPHYLRDRVCNIDVSVRKDHTDAFVRHLATDPEIHTIKVGDVVVYRRPEGTSGIDEAALAEAVS